MTQLNNEPWDNLHTELRLRLSAQGQHNRHACWTIFDRMMGIQVLVFSPIEDSITETVTEA